MRRIREIELPTCPVVRSRDHCRQPQFLCIVRCSQRELVVQRFQQSRCIANVVKLMQQLMNMTRHSACHIAVPNAVRQHHPRNIIAAREQCREIPACIAAAGHRNHVAL